MPQFGDQSSSVSFPSWATPSMLSKISWHPHPATTRVGGCISTIADQLMRPWATRHWGRLTFGPGPASAPEFTLEESVHFWFDFYPSGDKEMEARTGVSDVGFEVRLRVKYYDVLPVSGLAGVEVTHQFYEADFFFGERKSEYPNEAVAYQFNQSVQVPKIAGVIRVPDDDEPLQDGRWLSFEHYPISECWRWWNTHRTAPCQFESDPSGMSSMGVKISGFDWGNQAFGIDSPYTDVQNRFLDFVNSEHVLEPVYSRFIGGWTPCYLKFVSGWWADPAATAVPLVGLAYSLGVTLEFHINGIKVIVHVRVSTNGFYVPWELFPSQSVTQRWLQFGGWLSASAGTSVADTEPFGLPAYPIESRDIEQYQFGDADLFPVPRAWPWNTNIFDWGTVRLANVAEYARGTPLPPQAPLDIMPTEPKEVLIPSSGVATSINSTSPMVFAAPLRQAGVWWAAGSPSDIVIPANVRFIRGVGQGSITPSNLSSQVALANVTNPFDVSPVNARASFRTTQSQTHQLIVPKLPVTEGDVLRFTGRCSNQTWGASQTNNWLYLEGIAADAFPVTYEIAKHGTELGTVLNPSIAFVIPSSIDGWRLRDVDCYLGEALSSGSDVVVELTVVRFAGHASADLLDDPITIDAGQWSSVNASVPPDVKVSQEVMLAGDIILADVVSPGVGGKGLSLSMEFEEVIP